MSTLKVNNLQDITGANNSTPEQVAQGRAKFWVTFEGDSTGTNKTINDSFNVSTVTDNGTGDYTINFTNNLSNNNYCVLGGHVIFSNGKNAFRVRPDGGIATNQLVSSVRIQVTADGSVSDATRIYVAGFGD